MTALMPLRLQGACASGKMLPVLSRDCLLRLMIMLLREPTQLADLSKLAAWRQLALQQQLPR